MNGKTWLLEEPSIEEILEDPIVRLLMRQDGVSEDRLRDAISGRGRCGVTPPDEPHADVA